MWFADPGSTGHWVCASVNKQTCVIHGEQIQYITIPKMPTNGCKICSQVLLLNVQHLHLYIVNMYCMIIYVVFVLDEPINSPARTCRRARSNMTRCRFRSIQGTVPAPLWGQSSKGGNIVCPLAQTTPSLQLCCC